MKILITTDWYRPVINGVVTSVISLTDELAALGHEIKILTLSGTCHSRVEGNVTYIGSIGVGKIYPNARLKSAPSSRFVSELIAWRPDVVHSQCELSTFFLARKIAEECGCPLVHTYHTVYEDYTNYFSPSVRLGKYVAATFSRAILEKTQAVVVPTEKVRDMLQGYGVRTGITVVPSGLKLEQYEQTQNEGERTMLRAQYGIGENDRVLIYLGRLAKEKNIEELFALLKKQKDESLRMLLVGDGPYREQLEAAAEQMGLSGRVIFAGMVSSAEVAHYYRLGDVFVSASQSETQGLTYIEAMASGLPLLCRDDPCLHQVIENGVNGFTYRTPEQFEDVLQRLLSSAEYRRRIGAAAAETAMENFSAASFAKNILSLYTSLLPRADAMLSGSRNTPQYSKV